MIVLVATGLMMALGAGLILASSAETAVAGNFRHATGALYAADALMDHAIAELAGLPDWTNVPSGLLASGFIDGVPGARIIADQRTIDLREVLNLANCRKRAACQPADLDAVTTERPWGATNPRWQLFAHGPLDRLLGAPAVDAPFYVVAMVADDPSDNDGDFAHDGLVSGGVPNPGSGVLFVRVEAFGPRGSHRTIEATIARIVPVPPGSALSVALLSRREVS